MLYQRRKMARIILLFLLPVTLLVAGCSSATPEPLKTDLPPVENNWAVKMTHSGGIMGLSRSIEISSDGSYTVIDERSNQSITKKLTANELSKLQEIISNAEYITPEKSLPSGCADCFIYNLEIQGNAKKFSVQVDDISLPNSGMETLITYLRGLIDAALK
jgi:hypothetical protein